MTKEKVFTCSSTEDLSGICELCGCGIGCHDLDYKCLHDKKGRKLK